MKIRNALFIAGVAASAFVISNNSIAAVYTYNLTFDPSTFPCETAAGFHQCYAFNSIVPPTDNPGDEYNINVSFTKPIVVGPSGKFSQVYAGFYDLSASFGGGSLSNALEYNASSVTGYVGPAGLSLGGFESSHNGYYGWAALYGPNPGFTVTGLSTTIDVKTKDPYPLVQLIVASDVEVPEPATWTMLLAGLGGVGLAMRSRRRLAVARL
ncbi:MAG TPA: PEPxxWA-CTERM sorting domain-containing protein [Caulobacteraceae bacterium]|jgi:hypothetical protein